MKNKKIAIIIVVSLILATIVGFTVYKKVVKNEGLFENSTKVFSEIYLNTKNLKSYDMDIKTTLNDTSSKVNLQVDLNNNIMKNTLTTQINDIEKTVETYQQISDKEIITYTNVFNDNWLKQSIETKEGSKSIEEANEYLGVLEDFDNIEKLKSDKKGYNKYQITVSASKLADLVPNDVKKDSKLIATIYTDEKYIKSINYKSESEKINIELVYNKVNIKLTIPEDVISNAKTIDEINLSNMDEITNAEELLKSNGIDSADYQKMIEEAKAKLNSSEVQQQLQETQQKAQEYIGSEQHQQQIQQAQEYIGSEQHQQQMDQAQDLLNSIINQ